MKSEKEDIIEKIEIPKEVKKRSPDFEYIGIIGERRKMGLCLHCEKPKIEWTRRKDWNCCSKECSKEFMKIRDQYFHDWGDLKRKAFRKYGRKCKNCGSNTNLECDHIEAVALGGDQWSLDNLQILCYDCHKIKTAEDVGKLAQVKNLRKKYLNQYKFTFSKEAQE